MLLLTEEPIIISPETGMPLLGPELFHVILLAHSHRSHHELATIITKLQSTDRSSFGRGPGESSIKLIESIFVTSLFVFLSLPLKR